MILSWQVPTSARFKRSSEVQRLYGGIQSRIACLLETTNLTHFLLALNTTIEGKRTHQIIIQDLKNQSFIYTSTKHEDIEEAERDALQWLHREYGEIAQKTLSSDVLGSW